MTQRTAWVTGGTGFIGSRLAGVLASRGYRVRCLVRRPEQAKSLSALGAELVQGDVADVGAHARGLEGADVAWHLAGVYELGQVDAAAMEHTNVKGTAAFLSAVRDAGVRGVHVSTTVALQPAGEGEQEGDPDRVLEPPFPSEYQRTKVAAHRLAREAQRDGAPVIIVCPAYVYGPGDTGMSGQYMVNVLRHRVPGLSTQPTWFSFVHVDDVVDGLVAAGERGTPGATYVLSGEHSDVNRFTRMVASMAGTWAPPLRFPPFAVRATGALMDVVSGVTGARMPISRELALVAGSGARYLHPYERAARELGYAPRSLAEGLPETVAEVKARL